MVVGVNYRLNVFGFLAHEALRREDASRSTGNVGLRDQRLALRWVQANVGAFGGDSSKVTIFGQSAGAISVGTHYAAEARRRLQQRRLAVKSYTCDGG